jgi:hypothetical protein
VVGGFSQGFAVSLVTGLGSEQVLRENWGCSRAVGVLTQGREDLGGKKGAMKVSLARGTKDLLVPLRIFRETNARGSSYGWGRGS